jgi:hypothetical protein
VSDDPRPQDRTSTPREDVALAAAAEEYLAAADAVEEAARGGDPSQFLTAAARYGLASERYAALHEEQGGTALVGLLRAVEADFRGGPSGGTGVVYAARDERPPLAAVREGVGGTWWVYRLEGSVHDQASAVPEWRPVYADPQRLPR